MVTALVFVPPGPLEPLGLTLAALVRGVTDGVVADAVVILPAPDPDVARVADGAGADLVVAPEGRDPWAAGAARARRALVLCLEAGDVPGEGWTEALGRFAASPGGPIRLGRFRRGGERFAVRAARALEAVAGVRRPRAGDVLSRSALERVPFAGRVRPVRIGGDVGRHPGLG